MYGDTSTNKAYWDAKNYLEQREVEKAKIILTEAETRPDFSASPEFMSLKNFINAYSEELYGKYDQAIKLYESVDGIYQHTAKYNSARIEILFKRNFQRGLELLEDMKDNANARYLRVQALLSMRSSTLVLPEEAINYIRDYPNEYRQIAGLLWQKLGDAKPENIPMKLRHYTSMDTVRKIIDNQKLRATRIDFLNDKSERAYLIKHLDTITQSDFVNDEFGKFFRTTVLLTKRILQIPNKRVDSSFMNQMLAEYRIDSSQVLTEMHHSNCAQSYYVFCLTEENDRKTDLTLWGLYSNFSGCTIEFNTEKLDEQMRTPLVTDTLQYYPVRVIYGMEQIEPFLNTCRSILALVDFYDTTINQTLMLTLIELLLVSSACFKTESFAIEKEWRCLFVPKNNSIDIATVKFDVRNQSIYPFIEIPITITSDLFNTFWIGPKNYSDTAKAGLQRFLHNKGIRNTVKETNTIFPFRF